MAKFTQQELIEDSHKKLAFYYNEWSLLLLHYFDDLYVKNYELSEQDKRKLSQNPKYSKEIQKKMINENFTITPVPEEYWENTKVEILDKLIDQDFQQQLIAAHDDQKAIVKSIGKEKNVAIGQLYYFDNGERVDLDLDNSRSFMESAYEHRILSIIYDNYEDIVKLMKELTTGNIHYIIETYKDIVTRDSSELIIKWSEKIKRIRSTRKGGGKKVDKQGFLLAIREVLKIRGNDISRENIWRYFEKNHNMMTPNFEPMDVGDYEIYFDPGMDFDPRMDSDSNLENIIGKDLLVQKLEDKKRGITKGTFFKYITEIRPKRKK